MQLQQSGFSGFGYSPSAANAASGSPSDGTSQATARKLLLGSVWSALGLSGPTGGVQDIASALGSALSTGLASGQDLAPQLTQTVDNALDQVSQQLEAQGVSPDHVAKLVARFRQDLADAVNSAAAAAANGGAATSASATTNGSTSSSANTATGATATAGVSAPSSSSANSLASSVSELATVRESESLTIQTTDGAQVTLRFRAQGAELGTSQTQSDGSTSTAAALIASGKFQVEVSGNLSSSDLAAINNIVSQVNSLATQFFSGDVQDAFAAAASIGADPSEIAGFSLQMSYSATLYQQVGTAADPGNTNTAAPAATPTPNAGTTTAGAAPDATTSTPASAAPAATATPQQTIANFLQNALAKLGGPANGSSTTLSARWGIQLLAVALPIYAQSQSATGSSAVAGAQSATPTSASPAPGTGNTSPAVTQVAITARTQAAHLAAATLIQLVN